MCCVVCDLCLYIYYDGSTIPQGSGRGAVRSFSRIFEPPPTESDEKGFGAVHCVVSDGDGRGGADLLFALGAAIADVECYQGLGVVPTVVPTGGATGGQGGGE